MSETTQPTAEGVIPALLAGRLASDPGLAAYAEAVERHVEAQAALGSASRAVERAEIADRKREREALRASASSLPKPTAGRKRAAAEEAARRRDVALELVNEAERDLIAAARPEAEAAAEEADRRIEAELDAFVAAIEEAERALLRAGEAEAAGDYCRALARGGRASWQPGSRSAIAPNARGDLGAALVHVEEARQRRRRRREQAERDEQFAEREVTLATSEAERQAAMTSFAEEPGKPEDER
jgi:hypothetical protein